MTYIVKGVFNYGEYIRLVNPISVNNSDMLSEKEINVKTDDVKICKYGSGLLFQLPKEDKRSMSEEEMKEKEIINKLSKKEQIMIDTKGQRSIDDAWG